MDEEAYLRKFANVILKGINSRNPRKNVSKEEQIYGIWAENSEDPKTTKSQRFTKGSKTPQISISEDHFGSWEKHTTGFGSKMLEKMGYAQGQGLGKRGSGIIEPIQAVPRQGRATLGAYGSDNNSVYQNSLPTVIEQKPEIIKDLKTHSWKKINRSRPNYIIKTFEQLLLEAQKATFIDDSVKVVDMTGSETKVTYGYETIQPKFNEEVVVKPKNFDLPELYHNIDILVKTSEKTLKSFIKK
uniref:Tuftelin-interacting protein 11 (Trinotate prediction) n=1 Tax=Henneguya salminicola TaxID=69463 RepID=A0A6G3ME41_HENSL